MKHYEIIGEQSDALSALFLRSDAALAIVEGEDCWLADDIDATQFRELSEIQYVSCAGCGESLRAYDDKSQVAAWHDGQPFCAGCEDAPVEE
jgi:formylmethanofuran dehydrogenase subunit E